VLDLDDPVPIMSLVPMLLFAVLFGRSMDYEVFLLSAIREGYRDTGHPDRAVIAGLARTGRVITAAALIMSVVFISFASIDEVLVKMIGVGLATAVIIDATVIRMVLALAVMSLLGPPRLVAHLTPKRPQHPRRSRSWCPPHADMAGGGSPGCPVAAHRCDPGHASRT
jgi:uncharacterized membrane protein YdfJ with MMPL/SSD domain